MNEGGGVRGLEAESGVGAAAQVETCLDGSKGKMRTPGTQLKPPPPPHRAF
jgi:hypothetical protein